MESLKKLFKMSDWFKDGLESVGYNIIGNLIPIYVMIFIAFSENGFDSHSLYNAIHQPFTYLILSGTYLTHAYYISSKAIEKNKVFPLFYGVILICIGLLIKDKNTLEDLTANFYKELVVVFIFIISFGLYIYHQFNYYYQLYNTNPTDGAESEFERLKKKFKKVSNE